jgi:hypothetical protein
MLDANHRARAIARFRVIAQRVIAFLVVLMSVTAIPALAGPPSSAPT